VFAPKVRVLLLVLAITVPLDQGAKLAVESHLDRAERVPVVEGVLYVSRVGNPGVAFGLLRDRPAALRLAFFVAAAALAFAIVAAFFRHLAPGDRTSALGLGLVLGGAIGNVIDRVSRGEVLGFVQVRLWEGRSWPDFNLADGFIVAGAAILVVELLASEAESRTEADPGSDA
jgi:signal peptidase II